ncbi:MAG: HEAT repeat domain-containing protein [Planctomycetes bacterium]|nr:HEAT repeat domain-containing protein [Planctomycetota bacterium]
MNRSRRNGIAGPGSVLFVLLLAGCGSGGKSPPAAPLTPEAPAVPSTAPSAAPSSGAASPAPPAAAPPSEFSVSAEPVLAGSLVKCVSASELWKAYFQYRLSQPGAKTPLVSMRAAFERKLQPGAAGQEAGGYKPGSVKLTLSVSDGVAELYAKERTQALPSVIYVKGQSPQEAALREAESIALQDLCDDAALCLMASHPDVKDAFLKRIDQTLLDEKARVNLRAAAAAALAQAGALPGEMLSHLACLACVPAAVKGDTNCVVSNAAEQALGKIGAPAAAAVGALMQDPDSHARERAARVLPKLGAPAIPVLAEAVRQKDWVVYVEVLKSLKTFGKDGAPACPALLEEAQGRDPMRRDLAVEALAQIGAPAVSPLLDALSAAKNDEAFAGAAISALERIGPDAKAAVPALEEIAKGKNRFLSGRANSALKKIRSGG